MSDPVAHAAIDRIFREDAAINAVHTDAPTVADTDWGQVATLYDQLYAMSTGSPETTSKHADPRGRVGA